MARRPAVVGGSRRSGEPLPYEEYETKYQNYQGYEGLERLTYNQIASTDARLGDEFGRIQDTADQKGLAAALNYTTRNAEAASDRDAAQFERATRTMGLTDRQKGAATRQLGLRRSLNRAQALDATRTGFRQRAEAAQSMGRGFSDAFLGQELSQSQTLGEVQAADDRARMERKYAKSAATKQTIGTIAGLAMAFMSSEKLKDDRGSAKGLLDKLGKVRVNRWNYKGAEREHIGPFAEEFNREFGVKTDRPDMINVIDALGVTLGAVKELNEKVEARG